MAKLEILLIDDDLDFLRIMSARMEKWGYNVIIASEPQEAIFAAANKNPDIMILDCIMPKMSGIELLRKIRKVNEGIPVIMLTGHPDIRSVKGASELGVSCYAPKLCVDVDTDVSLKSAIKTIEGKISKRLRG